jgi:MoaA/NifB/PqqE/SkfB family radical SAM enzyme
MKNPFTARLGLADRLYPLLVRLPGSFRALVAGGAAGYLRRRVRKGALPDRLHLFVTGRCNLRCPHCFIVTPDAPKTWDEMALGEYERFFTRSRSIFSLINITGGEPTLHRDYTGIVLAAAGAAAIPNVNVFTNGLVEDRLLEALGLGLARTRATFSFQVSIDGEAAFHDANRGVPNALEKTLRTMTLLKQIREKHPRRFGRLAAATAISRKNLDDLPAVIELVRRTGFLHAFTFVRSSKVGVSSLKHPEELSDMAPYNFSDYLSVEEMRRAIAVIGRQLWGRHPDNLYYATNRVTLETIAGSLQENRPRAACLSGVAECVLLPNGDVARCEMLRPATNLRDHDYDPRRLFSSDAYRNNLARTRGCWCTHDCGIGISIMHSKRQLIDLFSGNFASHDSAAGSLPPREPRPGGRKPPLSLPVIS